MTTFYPCFHVSLERDAVASTNLTKFDVLMEGVVNVRKALKIPLSVVHVRGETIAKVL